MATPLSLRIARLLLVAAGAGGILMLVFYAGTWIAQGTREVAPIVLVFPATGLILLAAARELARDAVGARLLAWAGASGLAGMGILAGFGAGFITIPIGTLAVLGAWAAVLAPPRRRPALYFAAYLLIGLLVVGVITSVTSLSFFTIWIAPLWPWMALVWSGPASLLAIYAFFGVTGALLALYGAHRRGTSLRRVALSPALAAAALAGAVVLVAGYVAIAFVDQSSSLRFELGALPIALLALSGAGIGFALASFGRAPIPSALGLAVALPILLVAVMGGSTVTCYPNGTRTGRGPWWMPYSGQVSSSVSSSAVSYPGGPATSAGRIERGDGVVISYRCEDGRLVEFRVEP